MRVEIYSNDDTGSWQCVAKASPGNISMVEDMLFDSDVMQDSQTMVAVIISNRTIGVAFVDVTLKTIGTMQVQDNEQLCNLESFFWQVRVSMWLIDLF